MFQPIVKLTLTGNPALGKQVKFAIASALTLTAKEAQSTVIKEIEGAFTVRTNWDKPWSPFGVRIQPASNKSDNKYAFLKTIVGMDAQWMEKFLRRDSGIVVNLPQGKFLAIPTQNVRRTKRELLIKSLRPNALRGKRDVLLPMKSGGGFVLFQRRGRGKRSHLVALYILKPLAKIKQTDVFFGPIKDVFARRFPAIYERQLQVAFATAR